MSMKVVAVDYPPLPTPNNVVVEYDSAVDHIQGASGKSRIEVSKSEKLYPTALGEIINVKSVNARGITVWQRDFTSDGLDALRHSLNIKFDRYVDDDYDDYPTDCNECPEVDNGSCRAEQYPD